MKNIFRRSERKQLQSLQDAQKEIERLEQQLQTVSESVGQIQEALEQVVSNVGIVRFNPFREIGGDQSFTISLLDAKRNGVVITSHYGRDSNRVYAKPVRNGECEYMLSDEEKHLIAKALNPSVTKEANGNNEYTTKKRNKAES